MKRPFVFYLLFFSLLAIPVFGQIKKVVSVVDIPLKYRDSILQLVPIPYFDTSSAEGQRYGIMPTFLWYDKDPKTGKASENVHTVLVTAFTYNPQVVKFGGLLGLFLYPSAKERLEIFLLGSQKYEQDFDFHYINGSRDDDLLTFETRLEYQQDPFERFFGFGPDTPRSNESNFVSHHWIGYVRTAYEIFKDFDVQLEEDWKRMRVLPRALPALNDTSTFFAGSNEVGSFNQWTHTFSLVWDTRDDEVFPKTGSYLQGYGLLSHQVMNANRVFHGTGAVAKHIFTLGERFTTMIHFRLDELFGDTIPFYLQPRLGGPVAHRGFIEGRFTGHGRFLLDLEERIFVKNWNIMDAKFGVSIDPFFSVGQVFNRWEQVQFSNLKPLGGVGFRAVIPPSVLGRVDIGFSEEGMEIYTALDYPF
ncbi:MAG: BamA/TamA family outer membrane protein [Deltaproteobacteria bacterium]|nr:BamA/TamA family outer membrane protein [Deltaproteobacteria bacterium]